jgi:hypothetical protein
MSALSASTILRDASADIQLSDGVRWLKSGEDDAPVVLIEPLAGGGYSLRYVAYLLRPTGEATCPCYAEVVRIPMSLKWGEDEMIAMLKSEIARAIGWLLHGQPLLVQDGGKLPSGASVEERERP